MIKLGTLEAFIASRNNLIESVKVTSFKVGGFDEYVGYTYYFNLKVNTIEGYENKFLKCTFNSTWAEGFEATKEGLQEYLENFLESFG